MKGRRGEGVGVRVQLPVSVSSLFVDRVGSGRSRRGRFVGGGAVRCTRNEEDISSKFLASAQRGSQLMIEFEFNSMLR